MPSAAQKLINMTVFDASCPISYASYTMQSIRQFTIEPATASRINIWPISFAA
jgi:hypothetical protein